jgi:hypothetical protein
MTLSDKLMTYFLRQALMIGGWTWPLGNVAEKTIPWLKQYLLPENPYYVKWNNPGLIGFVYQINEVGRALREGKKECDSFARIVDEVVHQVQGQRYTLKWTREEEVVGGVGTLQSEILGTCRGVGSHYLREGGGKPTLNRVQQLWSHLGF